ncbi:hypothetical protein AAEX37_01058 [Oligella sp. MSHR50489EDL]|uniref:lytic transglycosylase domain-containing protein n=1 Tax=Oligella sp. MSHR50489EDL TaxID=3139409 RepID=UPI003D81935C
MYQPNFISRHVFKTKLIVLAMSLTSVAYADVATETPEENAHQVYKFNDLALECAKEVHPKTLQALVRTESGFNPYAIGVVGGSIKQPTNFTDAVAAAKKLHDEGRNFSMGLAQINRYNLAKYGLDYETVFEPCKNLFVGQQILTECFGRAGKSSQETLQKALSCYYSGNFKTGFSNDLKGLPSYVERIISAASKNTDDVEVKILMDNPDTKEENVTVIPEIDINAPIAKPVVAKATVKRTGTKSATAKVVKVAASVDLLSKDKKTGKNSWDVLGDW